MPEFDAPPLAMLKPIHQWVPKYGDFVIWAGWFNTWYGLVVDEQKDKVLITFEGTPYLLVTMSDPEISSNIKYIQLFDIKGQRRGKWAILQRDNSGHNIWYI